MASSDEEAAKLHNELAGQVVMSIVKPIMTSGGTTTDVMILTESVLVGVSLACIKLGGDERVLDLIFERARERLAELRLAPLKPEGNA